MGQYQPVEIYKRQRYETLGKNEWGWQKEI